ncbi:MAG TPA: hypothetical protein VGJ04_04865 [Pirellulales bacterium]
MNRIVLLFVLAAPTMLVADEVSTPPCEQCAAGDCRDGFCDHCGCQAHCQKVCHPVCEWKDMKETVYGCRCQDVCIPGRSEEGCTKVDECNPYNCPLCHDYKPLYTLWKPAECARIRSVTTLVKYEVTHKVPTYKWVVEYCCDNCRHDLSQNAPPPDANGPPAVTASPGVITPPASAMSLPPVVAGLPVATISQQ